MQYALLIYGDESKWESASPEERKQVYAEYARYSELLESRNALRGGAELKLTATATTVRRKNGEVLVTDGPFAETTEQFGGFYLVEAANLDEALEFAKALPADIVEVRPIVEAAERP